MGKISLITASGDIAVFDGEELMRQLVNNYEMSNAETIRTAAKKMAALVREMRQAQKGYFTYRKQSWLQSAKDAEKRVDKVLSEFDQTIDKL